MSIVFIRMRLGSLSMRACVCALESFVPITSLSLTRSSLSAPNSHVSASPLTLATYCSVVSQWLCLQSLNTNHTNHNVSHFCLAHNVSVAHLLFLPNPPCLHLACAGAFEAGDIPYPWLSIELLLIFSHLSRPVLSQSCHFPTLRGKNSSCCRHHLSYPLATGLECCTPCWWLAVQLLVELMFGGYMMTPLIKQSFLQVLTSDTMFWVLK